MKLILQAIKAILRKIEASIYNAKTAADNAQTTANSAQATADNAKTAADSKMSAINPVGSGSFSMGRKSGSLIGSDSHAEGNNTTASNFVSHAEGQSTTASGSRSHAEGYNTKASGSDSHAEGNNTTASGDNSHAEGQFTTASGDNSHAEGYRTTASGSRSHAEGYNTTASIPNQHVQGAYNAIDIGGYYAHIVGNGVTNNERRNIHALDWDGNAYYKGTVYVNGTKDDASGGQEVATKSGWTANKYIGTDENGNLVEKDAPAGGTVGYPVVSMTASSAELAPNTYYKWGEIATLTVTLAVSADTSVTNEYCFEFVSGETATTLSVPGTVKWVKEPNVEAGKTYQVSILNGIGVICGA